MDVLHDGGDIIAPRGSIEVGFDCVLRLQPRDIGPDLGVLPMPLEKIPDPRPRIAEERLVDEVDGCGRALDVQQDGADLGQRDAVFRTGMYVGPMQSG
jgi:hypothetical protein